MAVDFPDSPSNGDTYTVDGRTYVYNASINAWELSSINAASELNSLVDVNMQAISSRADGTMLVWDSALQRFVDQELIAPLSFTLKDPDPGKTILLFKSAHQYEIKTMYVLCNGGGNGTVSMYVRGTDDITDSGVGDLTGVSFDGTPPADTYAVTGTEVIDVGESLVVDVLTATSVTELAMSIWVKRLS